MKKSVSILLVFFSLCSITLAQTQFAIIGGANQSGLVKKINNYSPRIGLHAGVLADIAFGERSHFSFRPGVVFNNKGVKFGNSVQDSLGDVYTNSGTQYVNYIDMPMNLIYTVNHSGKAQFFIGAGPYLSFFYKGKETYTSSGPGFNDKIEVTDLPNGKKPGDYAIINYGVSGLAGIQVGKVFLNGTYSYGLNDFYKPADITNTSSFQHQVISATLGVFLNKREKPEKKKKEVSEISTSNKDKDSDGINDNEDKCPDEKGTAKYNGCPVPDMDGDGINDEEDACPTIKGTLKYKGCTIPDSDLDGIDDEMDSCKLVPGLQKYNGCPAPDADNDGVADDDDKCPDVPGKKEYNGCPMPVDESLVAVSITSNIMCYTINFDYDRAELQADAFAKLKGLVNIMKQDNLLQIDIEGHSDNVGTVGSKNQISAERAAVVKAYLLSYMISKDRIRTSSWADKKQLDAVQQWMNRRVDVCFFYKK